MSDGTRRCACSTRDVCRSLPYRGARRERTGLGLERARDGQGHAPCQCVADRTARDDRPAAGRLKGWVDLRGLLSPAERARVDVLNGIAYDEAGDRLFVTGKWWPTVFQIEVARLNGLATASRPWRTADVILSRRRWMLSLRARPQLVDARPQGHGPAGAGTARSPPPNLRSPSPTSSRRACSTCRRRRSSGRSFPVIDVHTHLTFRAKSAGGVGQGDAIAAWHPRPTCCP